MLGYRSHGGDPPSLSHAFAMFRRGGQFPGQPLGLQMRERLTEGKPIYHDGTIETFSPQAFRFRKETQLWVTLECRCNRSTVRTR